VHCEKVTIHCGFEAAIANRMETVARELSLAIDEIDIELAKNGGRGPPLSLRIF